MHTDILVLFKSLVPAHTRRLKTGKVVRVRQYRNKVNKRPDEDDRTRDMFADDTVAEPRQDLIAEHKRLVDVLESPSHKDDKVEAKKQKEELEGYEGKGDHSSRLRSEGVPMGDDPIYQELAEFVGRDWDSLDQDRRLSWIGEMWTKNTAGRIAKTPWSELSAAAQWHLAKKKMLPQVGSKTAPTKAKPAEAKAKPAPKVVSVKAR